MLERTRSSGTPPYTSYRTFKTFIEDLHEHGVPSRIDRSVLTRFSGIVGTQLMHALRFLGLIEDDGRPTERLKGAGESARDGRLARDASGDASAMNMRRCSQSTSETATPSHFNEAFRKAFPAADAVVQKCVTFFLYAANDAGVKISGRVLKGRKPRSLTPRRKPAKPAFAHPPIREFEAAPSPPQAPLPPLEGRKPSEILLTHLDLE